VFCRDKFESMVVGSRKCLDENGPTQRRKGRPRERGTEGGGPQRVVLPYTLRAECREALLHGRGCRQQAGGGALSEPPQKRPCPATHRNSRRKHRFLRFLLELVHFCM
jgi:hypothetical protein